MADKKFRHHRYCKPIRDDKKEFRFYWACSNFLADIQRLISEFPRSYRQYGSIGNDIFETAMETLRLTRYANAIQLGKRERFEKQKRIAVLLDDIYELYAPMERLGLITLKQNGEYSRKTDNLRITYEYWMSSDLEQIRRNGIKDEAAEERCQKTCYEE